MESHIVTIPNNLAFTAPFQLRLADDQIFFADEIVRMLPKRRLVAFGVWQEKPVVAKLFFGARHAKRAMKKDAEGVTILMENKIPTPTLYAQSVSADGRVHVLIYERIHDAASLEEIWRGKRTAEECCQHCSQS